MGDEAKLTGNHNVEPGHGMDASSKNYHDFRNLVYTLNGGPELAKVYDEWASKYNEEAHSYYVYVGPANLASIAADVILDKTARVLDAASGTGMVGEELKGHGFTNIDALDPSQGSLDLSKTLDVYTNYICDTLDEHQTQIPEDCYDAVLMCGAFGVPGHVNDACFPELIRISKPGAYIMFTVGTLVVDQWKDKLEAAIEAGRRKGLWELVEMRWCAYMKATDEKAMVPILRVTKGKI